MLSDYLFFAHRLPSGHVFQSRIQNLTGYNTLTAPPEDIAAAVRDFVQPDVKAPEKARDVAFGVKRRTRALKPKDVSTTVLNGNGITGSAANAAYELGQRGYKVLTPPSGQPQNAPRFNYFRTVVYYDPAQPKAKAAAAQLANLFGDADVKPLPPTMTTLANGAMATVVVGQNFHGTIAPAPVDQTPKKEPPQVTLNPSLTRSQLLSVRRRVPFRLELPRFIANYSKLEFDAPIRVYNVKKGFKAVRLTFATGSNEYWGIEETNWDEAPALADASFTHAIHKRQFSLYYAGYGHDGFNGRFKGTEIVELLQMVELHRKAGTLEMSSDEGFGTIDFSEGRLVDAACGASAGEEAAFRLLAMKSGFFRLRFHFVPTRRDAPTVSSVIFEHLRRADEESTVAP